METKMLAAEATETRMEMTTSVVETTEMTLAMETEEAATMATLVATEM